MGDASSRVRELSLTWFREVGGEENVNSLVQSFQQYRCWRAAVSGALLEYRAAASAAGLSNPVLAQRLDRGLARLSEDRLVVAFVAEFSRGKSELISAIFFAGYGRRILPSSAGRTTMCPTELMYDEALPPSIRLLPIETRSGRHSTSDLRAQPDAWESDDFLPSMACRWLRR